MRTGNLKKFWVFYSETPRSEEEGDGIRKRAEIEDLNDHKEEEKGRVRNLERTETD